MSLEGLLFGLIVALGAAIWIGLPLLQRNKSQRSDEILIQKQRERLVIYYERVLTNMRDLDEDHATDKMLTSDYEIERESWIQRGIQALKALDKLDASQPLPSTSDEAAIDQTIEHTIEDAVAAYRRRTTEQG
jgi:hypothetical protein